MAKQSKPSKTKMLPPAVKIIISVAVIALCLLTIELDFNIRLLSILKKLISIAAFLYSLVTLFTASAELRSSPKAIAKSKAKAAKVPKEEQQTVGINSAINFLRAEAIVEIDAILDNGVVKFGTSSDYNKNKNLFFDKLYYVEDKEYQSLEEMEKALYELFPMGVITIALIDGAAPKYFKIT